MKPIVVTEEMLATGRPVSQGEVNIWDIRFAPKEVLPNLDKCSTMVEYSGNTIVCGHSETGHHHILEPIDKTVPISKSATMLIEGAKDLWAALDLAKECILKHTRGDDTHKSYIFPPGKYVRKLREEQNVEGWQKVLD